MTKTLLLGTLLLSLAACESRFSPAELANHASNVGACPEAETLVHDIIQQSYEKTGEIASTEDVISEFSQIVRPMDAEKDQQDKLIKSFKDVYSKLELQINNSNVSKEETLKALGQLEFGAHPNKGLQENYTKSVDSFKTLSVQTFKDCKKPDLIIEGDENNESSEVVQEPTDPEVKEPIEDTITPPALPFFEELKQKTANLSHYGALKSFAVAYQSCEAISINPLLTETHNTEGISIVGKHSSGRGNKREITDITKVRRTHHYIKDYRKPASNCVNSTTKPLIYDFGGKPYTTTSTNSTLNFFKDGGSGSKELGVDCSGYVFSALMSAGLKLSPNKPLRARNVNAIPARHYKNPGSSMSCLKKVKAGVGTNLQAGDIFASNGHIFIVNLVGDDPLGVKDALSRNSCSSITYEDFDFTVLQSSPSKGFTGMNHMDGTDYLKTSNTMRKGFEKFARLDCENKRKNKSSTPSIDEASLVRHLMTPDCVAEEALRLDNQSCVERCSYEG